MPFDKTSLPAPPEFPASNASYNKIVGKMHKAVLGATTAPAAIAAVQSISAHVGGVNTYAKATRRYGEHLVAAIEGKPVEVKPAKAPKAKAVKIDAPAVPTKRGTAKIEQAAAKGDPVAGFMLAGLKAAKAAKAAVAAVNASATGVSVTLNLGKTFSNKSNAKRALKLAACDHLPLEWEQESEGHVRPVLLVKDDAGLAYVAERGFKAKVLA